MGLAFMASMLSPSRGLLFFAPVVIAAVVVGARSSNVAKTFAAAIFGQLVLYAAFHKWWGGVAFGPRLAAIPVWASCFVLFGLAPSAAKRTVTLAAAVTIAVGLIGLYGYDPRKWDLRVAIDREPARVWWVRDSVLPASLRPLPEGAAEIVDSPAGPFTYCVDRTFSYKRTSNSSGRLSRELPTQSPGI
jgi:hypothetical protein